MSYLVKKIDIDSQKNFSTDVPWGNDEKLRAVLYKGRRLILEPIEEVMEFTFNYDGEALDIESYLPIICNDVRGNISSKSSVECNDVGGYISSNESVSCNDVEGYVISNDDVCCRDVGGYINAGGMSIVVMWEAM